MKCKKCGQEFISLFMDICPYCGFDNGVPLEDVVKSFAIFELFEEYLDKNKEKK